MDVNKRVRVKDDSGGGGSMEQQSGDRGGARRGEEEEREGKDRSFHDIPSCENKLKTL